MRMYLVRICIRNLQNGTKDRDWLDNLLETEVLTQEEYDAVLAGLEP